MENASPREVGSCVRRDDEAAGDRSVLAPSAVSGAAARRGPVRLASFDVVTAVAAVGAIDALHGQDTVIPALDLSQSIPKTATVDLTEFDLDELSAVEFDPAPPRTELSDIDIGEWRLEQLLALEARPADVTQAEVMAAAIGDLMQVGVGPAEPDQFRWPFDLTGLALETLQDIQYGDDALRTETPRREAPYLRLVKTDDK